MVNRDMVGLDGTAHLLASAAFWVRKISQKYKMGDISKGAADSF
jgi:hypothetical protein